MMPYFAVDDIRYPLDTESSSTRIVNNISVSTKCKVTKTEKGYCYLYSIKNDGKIPVKYSWEILNRMTHFGQNDEIIWMLPPGENVNFVFHNPEPPFNWGGKTKNFILQNKDRFEKTMNNVPDVPKGVKMSVPKVEFYNTFESTEYGPLPKSYTKIDGKILNLFERIK